MEKLSSDNYFKILGLENNATLDQIKKAYRKKARMYHPDLNKREDATKIFIAINEAYEYLSEFVSKGKVQNPTRADLVREWEEYRRAEARKRAYVYARAKYSEFTKSGTYKTSMVLNKAQLYINLSVAIFVITMAVNGYIMKWKMVEEGFDPPSLGSFLFLLFIGLIFLLVSLAHLQAFYQNTRKHKPDEKKN